MTQTATNPGLQAAGRAYHVLHAVCEQTERIIRDRLGTDQPLTSIQMGVLHQNLRRERLAAEKLVEKYIDTAEDAALTEILEDVGPDDFDRAVEAMDLDTVVAYARQHNVGDHDIDQWLDDMWPEKESELRTAVAEHMMQEKGA